MHCCGDQAASDNLVPVIRAHRGVVSRMWPKNRDYTETCSTQRIAADICRAITTASRSILEKQRREALAFSRNQAEAEELRQKQAAAELTRSKLPEVRLQAVNTKLETSNAALDVLNRRIATSDARWQIAKDLSDIYGFNRSGEPVEHEKMKTEEKLRAQLCEERAAVCAEIMQLQRNAAAIDEEKTSRLRYANRDRWDSFPGEIQVGIYELLTVARFGNRSLSKLLELRRVSKQWEQDTRNFFRNTVESRLSMKFTSPAPIDITRRIQNVKYGQFKALALRNRFIITDVYDTKFYQICEFVEIFIRPSFLDELVPSPGRSPQFNQHKPGKYFRSSSFPSYSISTPCSENNLLDDEEEGNCTFKDTIRYKIDLDEWNGANVMLEYKQQHIAELYRGLRGVAMHLRKEGKTTNAHISRAVLLFLEDTASEFAEAVDETITTLSLRKLLAVTRKELEGRGVVTPLAPDV